MHIQPFQSNLLKRTIQLAFCLIILVSANQEAFSQTNYYYDGTGSVASVGNWDDNDSGAGTSPANFTDPDQIFNFTSSATLDAAWSVSGTNSKVVVGDGSNSISFIISEGTPYTGTAPIDVTANATLTITDNTVPNLGTLDVTSTVIYDENVADAGNQIIDDATYGNLYIKRGDPAKEISSDITVAGNFEMQSSVTLEVQVDAILTIAGDFTINGTVTFTSNVKDHLTIATSGDGDQIFFGSNGTKTIPCKNFTSTKTSGSVTLDNTNATTLDIGDTYAIAGSGDKNIDTDISFQSLTVNLSSGNAILQGATTVNGTLTFTSGSLELGSNNLSIANANSISGAGSSNYIITNSTGELEFTSMIAGSNLYPIGTSTSYNPVTINVNSGTPTISARVFADVLTDGTSGSTVGEIDELVNRTWSVNSASAGYDIDLTFQWNDGEGGGNFNVGDGVKIVRYSGGKWGDLTDLDMSVAGPPYTTSVSGVTSLSEFTLGDAGSTLPVTWLSFSGEEVYKGIASLTWKTATELNNKGFEVEKSHDGKNFEMIGFVEGAGTTNEIKTYGFTDEHLQQNTYYRLKQIDFDGKSNYSRSILVQSSLHIDHPFILYPNPVTDNKPINLIYQLEELEKEQSLQLQLHDMRGSLLFTFNGMITDLNNLLNSHMVLMPQGIYMLTLTDFATLTHIKVLKQ